MKESLRSYCLRNDMAWLLDEWDAEKNAPLTPEDVSYGSNRPIRWKCSVGHEWQAQPDIRRKGTRCPYCAGQKTAAGENDLATLSPALAAEWHTYKNNALTPADVKPGSKRLAWWQCEKGHEWTASPKSRMSGAGCPICAAENTQKVSLAAAFPQVAAEWHPTKNGALIPEDIAPGSIRRVWWRCEQGHEWCAKVLDRANGQCSCPVCRGRKTAPGENDFASRFPKLALEWAEENGSTRPTDVPYTSTGRVWWRCGEGQLYRARVTDRAEGAGCPYCAGRRVWKPQESSAPTPIRSAQPVREDRPAV